MRSTQGDLHIKHCPCVHELNRRSRALSQALALLRAEGASHQQTGVLVDAPNGVCARCDEDWPCSTRRFLDIA